MWNPDKEPKPETNPKILPNPVFVDEDEIFHHYFSQSTDMRKRYGIGRQDGKYFIENLEICKALETCRKERLRKWVLRMKEQGKWTDKG